MPRTWRNTLIVHDVLDIPWPIPDEVIQCCVTSPPFWGLRSYGTETWEGGDPGCKHKIIDTRQTDTAKVGSTKAGVQGGITHINLSGLCPKCGATRIDKQLGLEKTPEEYIANQVKVFREVWRVLRPDGTVYVDMGDSYAGSWGAMSHDLDGKAKRMGTNERPPQSFVKSKRIPRGSGKWGGGNMPAVNGLKPKDLCGIPWRLAFALQADGWWLRSDIIWNKPNPMPESCTDRPTKSHEYIFFLTKSGTSKYWTHRDRDGVRSRPTADYRWVNQITGQEVAEAPPDWKEKIVCPGCNGTGTGVLNELMGAYVDDWGQIKCTVCDGNKKVQRWKRVNLWRGHDYFYDQDAVREPNSPSTLEWSREIKHYSEAVKEIGGDITRKQPISEKGHGFRHLGYNPSGRNLRSVWTFATKPYPEAHFATFPPELPRRCILAGTSEKGVCPECGAPWERLTESRKSFESGSGKSGNPISGKYPEGCQGGGDTGDIRKGPVLQVQTLGWRPTCSCGHKETVPCIVLDPFIGSGTTAGVAIDLDRQFFGIDLNGDYLKDFAQPRVDKALARQRARQAQGILSLETKT